MNHLTVSPATLTSIAAACSTAADDIGSAATRIDADAVALDAVFGVIGTDFVGVVRTSTHEYRERMGDLADEARRIAGRMNVARVDYTGTDDAAAAAIAATTASAPREHVA